LHESRAMEERYRERGHYLVSIDFDEQELEETGILLFRVIEGPRVRVRAIEFSGRDTAAGKSFETWMKKYVQKKLAGEEASIRSEPLGD
jgi:outer membrane protein assembly factor BamA